MLQFRLQARPCANHLVSKKFAIYYLVQGKLRDRHFILKRLPLICFTILSQFRGHNFVPKGDVKTIVLFSGEIKVFRAQTRCQYSHFVFEGGFVTTIVFKGGLETTIPFSRNVLRHVFRLGFEGGFSLVVPGICVDARGHVITENV